MLGEGEAAALGQEGRLGFWKQSGGRKMPEDAAPRRVAVGRMGPEPGSAHASEPRPRGAQAALRGGSGGKGSRSQRQQSRVCVFIIIISD